MLENSENKVNLHLPNAVRELQTKFVATSSVGIDTYTYEMLLYDCLTPVTKL